MNNNNLENLVRPVIKSIKSYSSARNEFYNLDEDKIFMDANENPYKNDVNRYPDPFQVKLKKSIASLKLINSDQILLGNGSDEILDIIIRTFCEPNKDEVILLPPTYGMYEVLSNINQSIINTKWAIEKAKKSQQPVYTSYVQSIYKVLFADITISFDNVIGVVGAAKGNIGLMIYGLVLSVILTGAGATYLANYIQKHIWIAYIGLAFILLVAIQLIIGGLVDLEILQINEQFKKYF